MLKNMHQRFSTTLLLSIVSSTSLLADSSEVKKTQQPLCMPCEYDSTCCPQTSCWGTLGVKGEFLYWQPVITGMPYALTHTRLTVPFNPFGSTSPLPDNLSVQNITFGYSPGYRIGARYTLPKTEWDFSSDYVQFAKMSHASVQADGELFIDTLWDAGNFVNPIQATAALDVKLKVLNATIGKTIQFPHCFSFRPNVGVQFYKLDCAENIRYIGTNTVDNTTRNADTDIQLRNNSKGWGLLIGLDAIWKLPCYFEIFGRSDYGVLRTEFTFIQNQQTTVDTFDEVDLTSSSNFTALIQSIQVMGGVGWNYPFNCRNHPLAIRLYAAYEMNVWLQDVQVTRALSLGTGYSDALTTNIGNVGFRGLTAGAKFNF